jgi:hypothetical protein
MKHKTEHKQVEITVDDYTFTVDKGLEDIIRNFFHWEMETCNSCKNNNGNVWIEFPSFYICHHFMKMVLKNNIAVNGNGYVRETLFDFIQEKVEFSLYFDEDFISDVNSDAVIGNGELEDFVSLRFPKEHLETFRTLFFEVFPPK